MKVKTKIIQMAVIMGIFSLMIISALAQNESPLNPEPNNKVKLEHPQDRIIPELPAPGKQIRLLIDTDAANEIDDLYAVALAIRSPDRFSLEGLVATQWMRNDLAGVEKSYNVIRDLLSSENRWGTIRVEKGGKHLQSLTQPEESAGARFIIERAHAGSKTNPLWVVGLGAASNIASALMIDPSIRDKIRLVFHARSEQDWPTHTTQFNVKGDVLAARYLLMSGVPLVWFDTGAAIVCPMQVTEQKLLPLGGMPAFLHNYRYRNPNFQKDKKGFYDLGDIAWLIKPDVCTVETVNAPQLRDDLKFEQTGELGKMVRVHTCRPNPIWELFFEQMPKK